MNPNIDLTFADGVHIVVPDSLNFLTTYVLREQGDWFEDEIKFLRRLLKPGQRAIDIGASFGAYTLTMAKAVGPGGRVWAFEPISSTAATLASSIEINNFGHVVLEGKISHRGMAGDAVGGIGVAVFYPLPVKGVMKSAGDG